MYFVFKLSFLFHRVTNQNFKKSAKLLITNTAKIEHTQQELLKKTGLGGHRIVA